MLRGSILAWRSVQRLLAAEGRIPCSRSYSEARPPSTTSAGGSQPAAGPSDAAVASRLFEKVILPEAAAAGRASAGAAAAVAAEEQAAASTPVGRVFSLLYRSILWGGAGAGAFFSYYTYRYNADQIQTMIEETQKPENAFAGSQVWTPVMQWYLEKRREVEAQIKKYSDPPSDALLPDLPPQASHVRTLVLDLDDMLVHSDWSRERGWRTFKRPGSEDFLRNMSRYYELVVFTAQLSTYADPILDRLDPSRYIAYRLYRDSTQYKDGKHVRDLSKLNRDLGKVLLVTSNADAYYLQPDNAIKLPPWKLEADDTKLLDLMPFLEAVVRTNVPDVRAVVHSYEGEDIPTAFRERMQRLQETQQKKKPLGGARLFSFGK